MWVAFLLLCGFLAASDIGTTLTITSGSSYGNSSDFKTETSVVSIPDVFVFVFPLAFNVSITFPTSWSLGLIVWDYPQCQAWGNVNFTVTDNEAPSANRTFVCVLATLNGTQVKNITGTYLSGQNTVANFTFNASTSGNPYFVNCTATVSTTSGTSQTEAIRAVSVGQPFCQATATTDTAISLIFAFMLAGFFLLFLTRGLTIYQTAFMVLFVGTGWVAVEWQTATANASPIASLLEWGLILGLILLPLSGMYYLYSYWKKIMEVLRNRRL